MLLDQHQVLCTGLSDNLQDLNNSESCCLGLVFVSSAFRSIDCLITKISLLIRNVRQAV